MAEWPFERMNRSRSGQSGSLGRIRRTRKKSATRMSIADNGPPMWPAPALATLSTTSSRPRRATASRSSSIASAAWASGISADRDPGRGRPPGALADNDLDGQQNALRQDTRVDRIDQEPGRLLPELGRRDGDGREPGIGDRGERDAIEADDTDILGNPQPPVAEGVHERERELVVVADDRVRPIRGDLGSKLIDPVGSWPGDQRTHRRSDLA